MVEQTTHTPATKGKRLASLSKVPDIYPDAELKVAGLRWHRFNNTANFNKCVIKAGRRVLVDLDKFEAWLESQAA